MRWAILTCLILATMVGITAAEVVASPCESTNCTQCYDYNSDQCDTSTPEANCTGGSEIWCGSSSSSSNTGLGTGDNGGGGGGGNGPCDSYNCTSACLVSNSMQRDNNRIRVHRRWRFVVLTDHHHLHHHNATAYDHNNNHSRSVSATCTNDSTTGTVVTTTGVLYCRLDSGVCRRWTFCGTMTTTPRPPRLRLQRLQLQQLQPNRRLQTSSVQKTAKLHGNTAAAPYVDGKIAMVMLPADPSGPSTSEHANIL